MLTSLLIGITAGILTGTLISSFLIYYEIKNDYDKSIKRWILVFGFYWLIFLLTLFLLKAIK